MGHTVLILGICTDSALKYITNTVLAHELSVKSKTRSLAIVCMGLVWGTEFPHVRISIGHAHLTGRPTVESRQISRLVCLLVKGSAICVLLGSVYASVSVYRRA